MRKYILAIILLCCIAGLKAQDLDSKIAFHKGTIVGELPNGLKYVIQKNDYPQKKVELRMVVNIGSIVENADQKGMAHFIEHMAFNGTQKYPADKIIQDLRLMGVKYGFGLNAFTGYDKTIYIVPIPTDNPKNIDYGLSVIKEWASAMTILPEEVKDEKKVVLQEIRDSQSIDDFYNIKLQDSKYAQGISLGGEEDVNAYTSKGLKKFYNTWYRPNLITIIAVGDLNPQIIEKKIKEQFSSLEARLEQQERIAYSLKIKKGQLYKSVQDTMLDVNTFEIIYPTIDAPTITYKDVKNKLAKNIFNRLLSDRLSKDSLVKCTYTNGWYLSNCAHTVFTIKTEPKENTYSKIERVSSILAQIKKYGFAENEIENTRKSILENLSQKNSSKMSAMWCDDYVDLAVTKDIHIDNKSRYRFYKNNINTINTKDLEKYVNLFYSKNRILLCNKYNSNTTSDLNKKEILKAWKKGLKSKTKPYIYVKKQSTEEPEVTIKEFEIKNLRHATIVKEKNFSNSGVKEIYLNNGVRLVFKPTIDDDKEITVVSFARGGLSLVSKEMYPYLEATAAYVDMGGVGNLTYDELSETTYAKNINITTNIGEYFHGLYGSASKGNIKELLKLFYLKITSPQIPEKDYLEAIKEQEESFGKENKLLQRLNASAGRVLQRRIAELSGDIANNVREFSSKEEIQKSDVNNLRNYYKELFGNANGTTFIISGNYEIEKIEKDAVKYLGALAFTQEKSDCKFLGNNYPKGVYKDEIIDRDVERTQVTYLLHSNYNYSLKETLIFKIMRDIMQNRLLKKFREEMGMVYSPFVMAKYRAYPSPSFALQVEYSCDEKNVGFLEKKLFEEIEDIKKNGIADGELQKITQSFIVTKREVLSEDNAPQWRKKLQEIYLEAGSLEDFDNYDAIVRTINENDIKEAFTKYINKDQYIGLFIRKTKKLK